MKKQSPKKLAIMGASIFKIIFKKIFHPRCFHASIIQNLHPSTKIYIESHLSNLTMSHSIYTRRNCTFRVFDEGNLYIDTSFFNDNCNICCKKEIFIGKNCLFGPNVCIFDHDHDYTSDSRGDHYITGKIIIGNNVWCGANSVILKNAIIGDNCVIAAGTVVRKGYYEDNSLITNKGIFKIKAGGD